MAKKRPQVALVYDFDVTLSPGNMQEFGFIQATGKTKDEFWEKNIPERDRQFRVNIKERRTRYGKEETKGSAGL